MYKNIPTLQNIYLSSPSWMKSIFASIYSYLVSKKKYGKSYHYWINKLKETERMSSKDLLTYQNLLMRQYLNYIKKNNIYYNQFFLNTGIDVNQTDVLSEIKKLPLINKQDVRANVFSLSPNKHTFKKLHKFKSSGTTGTSLSIYLDNDSYEREYAFRWHYLSVAGAKRKDKFAYFIGNRLFNANNHKPPFYVKDFYERGIYYSIFHLSDLTIKHYVDSFNKYKPLYIKGYPSALYTFASLAKSHNLKVISVRGIFSASEMLHEYQKAIIEEVFQSEIFQWYGQVETTVNIHECEYHRLHIKEEYGLLELLNQHGAEAKPGEIANVIGTSWGNKAFPLIRYDTGDNMVLADNQSCPCGRNGRIIEKIIGRDEDIIITPDGKQIGRLDFVFKPIDSVKESQIIQVSKNEIIINIVPENGYSERDEKLLLETITKYIGNLFVIKINIVGIIEKSNNGKIRYVINKYKSNN